MTRESFGPCRPFPPRAPHEIGEPVRRVVVIPTKHPVVAPEPKTPSPVRQPKKKPVREKEPA
jgi:hypothetical protein